MREIKFRGKRVDNGEWVYGCLIQTDCRPYIKPIGVNLYRTCCGIYERVVNPVYEVIPETVGQYTGIKDKNGAEIYEGDVLVDKNSHVQIVAWDWQDCKFEGTDPSEYYKVERHLPVGVEPTYYASNVWVECEIVGNVYENKEFLYKNPELLGEKE